MTPEVPPLVDVDVDDEGESVDMDTAFIDALRPDVTLHTPLSLSEDSSENEGNVQSGSSERTESSSSVGAGEFPPLFGNIEGIEPVSTAATGTATATASQLPPYPFMETFTMTQMEAADDNNDDDDNTHEEGAGLYNSQAGMDKVTPPSSTASRPSSLILP